MQRSILVYPNVPAPTPRVGPYNRIAPAANFNYRIGTAEVTPENPGGRTRRPGVPSGKIIGANQVRDRPLIGWTTGEPLRAIVEEVFDPALPVVVNVHPATELPQHYIAMREFDEWRNIPLQQNIAQIEANRANFPNLYAEANANHIGQTFIAKLALAIIAYLYSLDLNLDNEGENKPIEDVLDAIGNIPRTSIQLLRNNERLRLVYLIIEFDMTETTMEGNIFRRFRGVNRYESWFANPELFRNVPGMNTRGQTNNHFRLLNLNNRLSNLDIFQAVYRWFQLYQFMPYGNSASFNGIKLTFRHEHVNLEHMQGRVLDSIRPPAALELKQDSTKNMMVGTVCYKVRCPSTSDRNCFFASIKDNIILKVSEFNYAHATATQDTIHGAAVNFGLRIRYTRELFSLGPEEPVDIMSEAAEGICKFYNCPVLIFDTSLRIIRNIKWNECGEQRKLVYFDAADCRKYFGHAKKNPEISFGHIGILEDGTPKKRCFTCFVDYWFKHECTDKSKVKNLKQNIMSRKRVAFKNHQMKDQASGIVTTVRKDYKYIAQKPVPRLSDRQIVYYDFETLNSGEKDEFQVYAAGVHYGTEYSHYYGKYAMRDFFLFLAREKKAKTMLLVAWNGGRFDAKLILRFALLDPIFCKTVVISDMLMNGNRILSLTMKIPIKESACSYNTYEVFDPINFFMCSLKSACSDFGVSAEHTKKSFPHRIIKKFEDIEKMVTLAELNDCANYYEGDCESAYRLAEPWTEEQVKPFMIPVAGVPKISLRLVSQFYLKADVMGMRELCNLFFNKIWDALHYDCWSYMTVSQMTYVAWHTSAPRKKEIMVPPSMECYDAIRKATYGGRVFVGRKEWISPKLQEDNLLNLITDRIYQQQTLLDRTDLDYDALSDAEKKWFSNRTKIDVQTNLKYDMHGVNYIQELDFNSLYPSVMYLYDYPLGEAKYSADMYSIQEEFDETGKLPIGFYTVSYTSPKTLFLAALPQRVKGALKWDLINDQGTYTSVDLENAYFAGYKIRLQAAWLYPAQGKVFQEHVTKAMELKKEGDTSNNAALRAYGKLMANSLYGKMLQALITEVTTIAATKADTDEFFTKYIWEGAMFIGETAILTGSNPDPVISRPYQFGAFILAYSRRMNWEKFALIDSTFAQRKSVIFPAFPNPTENTCDECETSIMNGPIYGDTDSMYVRGNQISNLNLKNEFLYLKNEDSSDYEKKHKKGKAGGVRILWMIAVTVKTYAYIYINSADELHYKIASKGIKPSLLNFRDFIEASTHFGSIDYRGRTVDLGSSIRGGISSSTRSSDFSKVFHVHLTRTFNKTSQTSRITLNSDFRMQANGILTVPVGHIYAGEYEGDEEDEYDVLELEDGSELEEDTYYEEYTQPYYHEDLDEPVFKIAKV
jgi:hypothetical protein